MYLEMSMPDETRIRELVGLIDSEKDPQKVNIFAAELERLLTVPRVPRPLRQKPTASHRPRPVHQKPRSSSLRSPFSPFFFLAYHILRIHLTKPLRDKVFGDSA